MKRLWLAVSGWRLPVCGLRFAVCGWTGIGKSFLSRRDDRTQPGVLTRGNRLKKARPARTINSHLSEEPTAHHSACPNLTTRTACPTKLVVYKSPPSFASEVGITKRFASVRGFVLWEMLLGLGIFCMGAIALTTALQRSVDTVILIHDESEVRQDLESILAEASALKLQPGKTAIFMGDRRIQYEREVIPLSAKNSKGQIVPNLWQVTVRATWTAQNRVRTSEAKEMFFQP